MPTAVEPTDEIRERFFAGGDGLEVVASRTAAVDEIVRREFARAFDAGGLPPVMVAAVGGYGRSQLFPHSDIDLLFLFERQSDADAQKERLARLLTILWDHKLRISQSVRTPAECCSLAADNAELHISLLDARYLAGDGRLFDALSLSQLPKFYLREQKSLLGQLMRMARERHDKFGNTIYHLEPNIKEVPGGLRDFQLACWIAQLANISDSRVPRTEEFLPDDALEELRRARQFLFSVRAYLHYFNGRDNNHLTFDHQDSISGRQAANDPAAPRDTAEWMRGYFRHVRVIDRLARRQMEIHASTRTSLLGLFRDRQSRLSNNDFVVQQGRIYIRRAQALENTPALVLDLFAFVARHGIGLSAETHKRINRALPRIAEYIGSGTALWPLVREILRLPHAYRALREMHQSGVLTLLIPEFSAIDCLVIRDFYHRYTVDEHTFVTIRNLHRLKSGEDRMSARLSEMLAEFERPERIYLALLLHDLGKGFPGGSHTERGAELAEAIMERLRVDEDDRELVRFLVREHLRMSETMTGRDIDEPDTVDRFAELVATRERLKALTLLTYADTTAVNPGAMTAWRERLLWQLYQSAERRLMRNVEDERIRAEPTAAYLELASGDAERQALAGFLEGLPRRYLQTRRPEEVYAHFALSRQLASRPAAVEVKRHGRLYEIVVMTNDRPFLLAALCAGMTGFGLNIEKAEVFANKLGHTVDVFIVSDPARTLELNPNETKRLARSLVRVADGSADPAELLRAKRTYSNGPRKSAVEPVVEFDNSISSRATVFQVIAPDRSGLLFDIASIFSQHDADIEVVLLDTQGNKAVDVFYVVRDDARIEEPLCAVLRAELLAVCRGRRVD